MARVRRDNDARYALRASFVDPQGNVIKGDTITIGAGEDPTDVANWNTAYSWGDHASAGYASLTGNNVTGHWRFECAAGVAGESFNSWPIEIVQPTANSDAMMTFHVSGDYAIQFGLDGSTNKLSVGGWSMGANMYEIYHAGNPQPNAATATNLADATRTTWKDGNAYHNVVGQLAWKNYGNNHTIFDASQGYAPSGGAVDKTNSQVAWSSSYPTLMGWNGVNTYGVRVDSAKSADAAGHAGLVTVNSGNTSGAWYPIVWHSGNTVYSTPSVQIHGGGGAVMANYFQLNQGGVLNAVSGNYGTVSASGGVGGWSGYSVNNRLVLMNSNSNTGGLYNDTNNQWIFYYTENSTCSMHFAGIAKISTTAAGASIAGALTASGNVTAYSDERLKSDIKTLDGSKVYEMRGVSFTKDGEESSGVIAQEMQKVAPELVMEGEEYLSVAYGNLVGYLIEAVKDLKAEVDELKRNK